MVVFDLFPHIYFKLWMKQGARYSIESEKAFAYLCVCLYVFDRCFRWFCSRNFLVFAQFFPSWCFLPSFLTLFDWIKNDFSHKHTQWIGKEGKNNFREEKASNFPTHTQIFIWRHNIFILWIVQSVSLASYIVLDYFHYKSCEEIMFGYLVYSHCSIISIFQPHNSLTFVLLQAFQKYECYRCCRDLKPYKAGLQIWWKFNFQICLLDSFHHRTSCVRHGVRIRWN